MEKWCLKNIVENRLSGVIWSSITYKNLNNMRLKERFIPRESILTSVDTYEIIEEYPDDKYLPSYLVYARFKEQDIHLQITTDIENNNIRIITAYKPTLDKWEGDFKTRRRS